MAQLTHKEIFDLLIAEVLEAYPHIENKLDFVARDILKHLNSNSDGVRARLGKGSFIKDDGKIDAREAFLLTWVEEVWDGENGNQALHDQLLSFMDGTPQEFSTYERELP